MASHTKSQSKLIISANFLTKMSYDTIGLNIDAI